MVSRTHNVPKIKCSETNSNPESLSDVSCQLWKIGFYDEMQLKHVDYSWVSFPGTYHNFLLIPKDPIFFCFSVGEFVAREKPKLLFLPQTLLCCPQSGGFSFPSSPPFRTVSWLTPTLRSVFYSRLSSSGTVFQDTAILPPPPPRPHPQALGFQRLYSSLHICVSFQKRSKSPRRALD